jgi:hypothetical protein
MVLSDGPTRISYEGTVIANTVARASTAQYEQIQALDEHIQALGEEFTNIGDVIELMNDNLVAGADMLREEVAWQGAQNREKLKRLSNDITQSIGYLGKYLGAKMTDIRWAVEQNTEVARNILQALCRSHSVDSSQFCTEGMHWYYAGDTTLAKERFGNYIHFSLDSSEGTIYY